MRLTLQDIKLALHAKGVRHSKKRDVILEIFARSQGHLSIDELLRKAKKVDSKIGYVTVYRTLKLLKESGLAHQSNFGDGCSRFEAASDHHHDHLICLSCGKIIEFEEEQIELLQERVAERYQFTIKSHVHEIHGYCSKCKPKP